MRNLNTLLFDLGGVLIELGSVADMMATSPQEPESIWENWITSSSVSSFESGNCNEVTFSQSMVEEFQLTISPDEFLVRFKAWPRGTYEGATELLEALSRRYRLICLSNTNSTHYHHFLKHQAVMSHFEASFLSHQTGVLKPQAAAFENVLCGLGLAPDEVLFFDDHASNVRAARDMGFHAEKVNAPSDIEKRLNELGLSV